MPLGVVIRRVPGVTKWVPFAWKAVAVLPGSGEANWRELRSYEDTVEFHAATRPLELHRADAESYKHGLSTRVPSIYVVMRQEIASEPPEIVLVTASPYEAQDYADSGEELVEKVPMPEGLVAWVRDFVDAHYEEEIFVKRRRRNERVDLKDDGIGDARIEQTADVYRAPSSVKSRLVTTAQKGAVEVKQ
ncbi:MULTISPECIES: DUF3305 domain-containing protein [Halocynthiibacter]|uniref:DUF3305 domain-containing protein n=1 Tax=Halocynthiibacter halioticoli TaxID=2986804 RepID=A0AAE3LS24_9RHOB|nr:MULTISPECIES: DUF3305 domain-containing protein [Halocynthiibacter]MCV6825089.1 DUF3305 domain-containing protein [Halocynthiibacter halioticoli]MCW4058090.1 DUF3305 domain-containing protein [Halocynthiibacter sp. SDUM655004]